MSANDVNIEDIMAEIRTEIKEKGYTSDMLSFKDVISVSHNDADIFDKRKFTELMAYLNTAYRVPVARPITGNPLVVFVKKVIRKFTLFILGPVVDHQSEYNAFSARAFNMVSCYINENSTTLSESEMCRKIEILELKLQTASKEIERLSQKISELEKK